MVGWAVAAALWAAIFGLALLGPLRPTIVRFLVSRCQVSPAWHQLNSTDGRGFIGLKLPATLAARLVCVISLTAATLVAVRASGASTSFRPERERPVPPVFAQHLPPFAPPLSAPPSPAPVLPPRAPPPEALSQSRSSLSALNEAFAGHGLLVHMTSDATGAEAGWYKQALRATDLRNFPVHKGCGKWCTAFSFVSRELPLSVYFGEKGQGSRAGLAFAATQTLWRFVQCAAAVDSNSAERACCACHEPKFCPIGGGAALPADDSGYCRDACAAGDHSRCHALAAGCGFNVDELARYNGAAKTWAGGGGCSGAAIRSGSCAFCEQPKWCDDADLAARKLGPGAGSIRSAADWLRVFGGPPGERRVGDDPNRNQCKFKGSQRSLFVATARAYNAAHHPGEGTYNEVNMYVGPGDGGVRQSLMEALVAIVVFRREPGRLSAADDDAELRPWQRLAAHLSRLGLHVPLVRLSPSSRWAPARAVNLSAPEHDVELVPPIE